MVEKIARRVINALENQSSSWPSSNTYCSDASPQARRPMPSQLTESADLLWNLESLRYVAMSVAAAMPTGRLTKKTQRQS